MLSQSLKNKLGQLFIVGFKGPELTSAIKAHLNKYAIGNFILFGDNYQNPEQTLHLTNQLHDLYSPSTEFGPSLIAVDHEGGEIQRFRQGFSNYQGQPKWAESNSSSYLFNVGTAMARELKCVGIDINFSPVLDIITHEQNLFLKKRVFSNDPEIVAKLGSALIRGMQRGGLMACAKHFPGHGCAPEDSHFQLPTANITLDELKNVHLLPFKRVVRSKVSTVMTAHVLFPQIDPHLPATMSPKFIKEILRDDMRFTGLVIADNLEMQALAQNYSLKERIKYCLLAGNDLLILGQDVSIQTEAMESLYALITEGEIKESEVDTILTRINKVKRQYDLLKATKRSFEVLNKTLNSDEIKDLLDPTKATAQSGDND